MLANGIAMWDLLGRVKFLGSGPWFMVGDFHKKFPKLMNKFCAVLPNWNLFDLGFVGVAWMYNNKQEKGGI